MATPPTRPGPKKKIIICCDGTGCTGYKDIKKSTLTNVSRISRCITSVHKDGTPQVVYYQSGIGTDGMDGWSLSNLLKQGLGIGLNEKIIEAYSFICHNYTQCEDEIHLIGFSRGAFTVRCVASLIHEVGVLTKAGLFRLPEVLKLWETESDRLATLCEKLEGEESLRRYIRIKVCAVWDTVSSLGIPRPYFLTQPPPSSLKFVHSDLCPGIDHAFQALSLHEPRRQFLPIVWRFSKNNNHNNEAGNQHSDHLEQCWFMGYHADVGGGNEDECLAHFALVWIISKLDGYLCFDEKNFWKPRQEKSSWTLSLAAPHEGLRFRIRAKDQNPMGRFYRLGGTKYRKPCGQFWDENGLAEVEPLQEDSVSNERMHMTVRLLTNLNGLPTCSSLNGIQPPGSNADNQEQGGPLVWNLPYEVYEDGFTTKEKELLGNWVDEELRTWQTGAVEGDPGPGTLIPDIKAWLSDLIPVPVDQDSD